MNFLSKLWIMLIVSSISGSAFAGLAPDNLQILEASDTSITFDWDDIEDAIGYYVYYGTQSASGSSYEVEGIDLIDESELVLSDLDSDTRYYVAFTSVDEFGSESEYSEEIEYVTLLQGEGSQSVSFRISDVEVIDETSLQLIFSTDLEVGTTATREFIIENKNTGIEIPVDISDVLDGEQRNVVVILGNALQAGEEYQVTVLDIEDALGNTIEAGIDAFINFTAPETFAPELESAGPEALPADNEESNESQDDEEEILEEESENIANLEDNESSEEPEADNGVAEQLLGNNAGTTISTTENILSAAEENEKLPQTGPEHWVLIAIALLISGGIYYSSTKKES